MNVLIALVIAIFVIVGAYVGYHAQLDFQQDAEDHNMDIELEIFNENLGSIQILQNPELKKIIL